MKTSTENLPVSAEYLDNQRFKINTEPELVIYLVKNSDDDDDDNNNNNN
jgi:hypothetical protein